MWRKEDAMEDGFLPSALSGITGGSGQSAGHARTDACRCTAPSHDAMHARHRMHASGTDGGGEYVGDRESESET